MTGVLLEISVWHTRKLLTPCHNEYPNFIFSQLYRNTNVLRLIYVLSDMTYNISKMILSIVVCIVYVYEIYSGIVKTNKNARKSGSYKEKGISLLVPSFRAKKTLLAVTKNQQIILILIILTILSTLIFWFRF